MKCKISTNKLSPPTYHCRQEICCDFLKPIALTKGRANIEQALELLCFPPAAPEHLVAFSHHEQRTTYSNLANSMKTWSYWRLFSSDFWGFHSLTWIDLDCGSPWHKYRAVIGPEPPGIIRSSGCLQKSPAQKTPSVFSVLQHSSCFKNYARAYLI